MKRLIEKLTSDGYLKNPRIKEAFCRIDRADFLPEEMKSKAGINAPLPIGYGQTVSQPLTVAFMLELLQPQTGDKILDVGSGSAWQSAMLAWIVGAEGKVIGIERIPELSEFGKRNCRKYNFKNLELVVGDGSMGYEKEAPYDKIIVAAAAFGKIPEALKEQLKVGGRLVVPVENSIWLSVRKEKDRFEEKEFPGFVFVPLISG